jgi:hypothetical protein
MGDKYKLESEAFDWYFIAELHKLPELILRQIPLSIAFKYNKNMSPNDLKVVSFEQKVWILNKFCNKKVFILAQEEQGLSLQELADAIKNADQDVREEDALLIKAEKIGLFVGVGDDVVAAMSSLHSLCNSPVYKYIKKLSSIGGKIKETDYEKRKEILRTFSLFLYNYEVAKKRISKSKSMSPEKLLILFHYSDGALKPLSSIYKKNPLLQQKTACRMMAEMVMDKWFVREGQKKYTCYRITTLGQHELDNIISSIIKLES